MGLASSQMQWPVHGGEDSFILFQFLLLELGLTFLCVKAVSIMFYVQKLFLLHSIQQSVDLCHSSVNYLDEKIKYFRQ